jgi:hypothetical protein
MQLSLRDLLVLVLCEGNLRNESDRDNWQETSKHRGAQLIPGPVTQNLCLLLFFAWRHRWMRFYPGNPVGPGVKFVRDFAFCGFDVHRFFATGFPTVVSIVLVLLRACYGCWL